MPIFPIFSKQQKQRQQANQPDVYQYDSFPQPFRVQVIYIWRELNNSINKDHFMQMRYAYNTDVPEVFWRKICDFIAQETGVFELAPGYTAFEECCNYLMNADKDGVLNTIHVAFNCFGSLTEMFAHDDRYRPENAILELNHRFREHGIGYQFEEGQIVRVDEHYVHSEVTKPALSLLQAEGFSGPLEEFMRAHTYYRKGEYKEAVSNAGKAFESTIKAICTRRKWPYDKDKDTAKRLIEIVFERELFPSYLQEQLTQLHKLLESGLPTVRNRTSGHGQGAAPQSVDECLAAYALHLLAANIILLIEADKLKS